MGGTELWYAFNSNNNLVSLKPVWTQGEVVY